MNEIDNKQDPQDNGHELIEQVPQPVTYPITEDQAASFVDRILSCDERIARIQEASAKYIRSIEQEKARLEYIYAPALKAYLAANLKGKAKSVKLITGIIGTRAGQDAVTIRDEAAAMAWAEKNLPSAIKKPEPPAPYLLKSELKQYFKKPQEIVNESTGEAILNLPDGVEIEPAKDKFYIEAPKTQVVQTENSEVQQ